VCRRPRDVFFSTLVQLLVYPKCRPQDDDATRRIVHAGLHHQGVKLIQMTRALLICGAIAGPLFILVVLIQDYTRPDFDPRLFPLSQLSLGNWGWVQMTNFVVAGILNLLYSVGLWRKLHPGPAGTWAPILTGVYGLGLVAVGVFTTDPVTGFPPGSVASPEPSWHGAIHALGGLVIFVVLAVALLVFARLFVARKQRWWAVYCVVTAIAMLVLFFGGFPNAVLTARFLRLATALGWGASSIIAIKLLRDPRLTPQTACEPAPV